MSENRKFVISEHPQTRRLKVWAKERHEDGDYPLTYTAAAAVLQCDPNDRMLRSRMRAVAKFLLREFGVVLICVPNVGYRNATAAEAADILAGVRKHVSRQSRTAMLKADLLTRDAKLTDHQRLRLTAEMGVAALVSASATTTMVKRIESSSVGRQSAMTVPDLTALLR